MAMPVSGHDLPGRIARHYDLPLQVSSFFALLILSECITAESLVLALGQVEGRMLAHKLRKALKSKDIEVRSRRTIGYWLDADIRRVLAAQFGVELGIGI